VKNIVAQQRITGVMLMEQGKIKPQVETRGRKKVETISFN